MGHVTIFYKDTIPMRDPLSVQLGHKISIFQYLQYERSRGFPDYNEWSTNNLCIDLLIRNSYDPSMYTLYTCKPEIPFNCKNGNTSQNKNDKKKSHNYWLHKKLLSVSLRGIARNCTFFLGNEIQTICRVARATYIYLNI